jgi:hypothetical protein
VGHKPPKQRCSTTSRSPRYYEVWQWHRGANGPPSRIARGSNCLQRKAIRSPNGLEQHIPCAPKRSLSVDGNPTCGVISLTNIVKSISASLERRQIQLPRAAHGRARARPRRLNRTTLVQVITQLCRSLHICTAPPISNSQFRWRRPVSLEAARLVGGGPSRWRRPVVTTRPG